MDLEEQYERLLKYDCYYFCNVNKKDYSLEKYMKKSKVYFDMRR